MTNLEKLINYKKKISQRYMSLEGGDVLQQKMPSSEHYTYSEKLDGHIGYAIVKGDDITFYNRSAKQLDLPHLKAIFPKVDGIWAGELYMNEVRSRSFHVSTAIANKDEGLHFAVFDAVGLAHEDKPLEERLTLVKENFPKEGKVKHIEWFETEKKSDVIKYYDECLEQGKEGIIVHLDKRFTYKVKPIKELDLTILAYSMKDDGSDMMRSMLVGVKDGDEWIVVASVGTGFGQTGRAEWTCKLEKIKVEADFLKPAKNNLAYIWIKPEIVVQIKCLEVITDDSNGLIYKEVMEYDEQRGYLSQGKKSAVSLISPVFVCERTDKTAGVDTPIDQVSDRVEYVATKEETLVEELSEKIFRMVYTKTSKKGTAIRKFVGIKTNKIQGYAPFVLFYTDYSMGRKDPLKTDVSVCSTEDKLNELLEKAIEKNIKKGWALVE